MASEVDICNTALAYVGEAAEITAISPPDGSAQAAHCARAYPQALNELLELHTWGFATFRSSLTQLAGTPPSGWLYQYGIPNKMMTPIAVLDPNAGDDYSVGLPTYGNGDYGPINNVSVPSPAALGLGGYTPQPFEVEMLISGQQVIYTNQANAILRYTAYISDTAKFSSLFTTTLGWLIASKIAGPLVKGKEGRAAALACYNTFSELFGKAAASDANDRRINPTVQTSWLAGR